MWPAGRFGSPSSACSRRGAHTSPFVPPTSPPSDVYSPVQQCLWTGEALNVSQPLATHSVPPPADFAECRKRKGYVGPASQRPGSRTAGVGQQAPASTVRSDEGNPVTPPK